MPPNRRLIKLALSLLAALPATAQQPDTLRHSIPAPPILQTGGRLGSSVAVEGSVTVVGAPFDDVAEDSGVVKVFDTVTGALLHVIRNPSPNYHDNFGWSVAISGTRVVVGVPGDATTVTDVGIAYVYDLASATPTVPVTTLLNPDPAYDDLFGVSVAIEGTRVAVGAYHDDTGASNAGSAYAYDLAGATPSTPVATFNNPSPEANDFFGISVAVSGTCVVVGASGDPWSLTNVGSAYVYDVSSPTPTVPVATLNNPSPAVSDNFGWSVAISGMWVVVGAYNDAGLTNARSAYVYDLSGATPTEPVATLNNPGPVATDQFGFALAISGTRVVIGAYLKSNGGGAYLYDLGSATPTVPVATLNNPNPAANDQFGYSVAISGTRLVIGARLVDTGATDSGSAYVYDLASVAPTVPVATLNNPSPAYQDFFGFAVGISGSRMVVGAPYDDAGASAAGSAYVYDFASATPTVPVTTLNNPSPAAADYFGRAVAIGGTRVVVGAYKDGNIGRAYIYNLTSATPAVPVVTLGNPTLQNQGLFGYAVAISGIRVVVGAYQNLSGGRLEAGNAYVYDLSSPTPTVPVATLNNPSPGASDNFGFSVAISGTRVVVGVYRDDAGATDAGSAYVYDLSSATPTVPVATLNNPSPAAKDQFGYSVGISGTRVVVGARYDDTGGRDAGSGYVYDLSSPTPTVPVATLNKSIPAAVDIFGSAVAIDGTTVVAGVPSDDAGWPDKGAAYIFAPADPDFDGDGLLDIWEYARFGSISVHTASDDTDRDGRNELLELAFDGDPTVPDLWAAPAVTNEGGFLTMTIQKRAGVNYVIESANNPDAAAFNSATTTTLLNNATILKVRDNFTPATAAERLIRVKVSAAP